MRMSKCSPTSSRRYAALMTLPAERVLGPYFSTRVFYCLTVKKWKSP